MVDTPIGTNSPSYTLVSGDLGATIYCRVTATNASGSTNAISNVVGPITSAVAPANAGGANLPNIADTTPEVTIAVSCTTGTWTGDPTILYAYQWKRGGGHCRHRLVELYAGGGRHWRHLAVRGDGNQRRRLELGHLEHDGCGGGGAGERVCSCFQCFRQCGYRGGVYEFSHQHDRSQSLDPVRRGLSCSGYSNNIR